MLIVDLKEPSTAQRIETGTLWDGKSWILHPARVNCLISADGEEYYSIGLTENPGDQQYEERTRKYTFKPGERTFRYVRFDIKGAGSLPKWHASEGEPSWFFIDEISVY